MSSNNAGNSLIIATKLIGQLDECELPQQDAWDQATPVAFCSDWRGDNADPQRETEARLLWSPDHLYVRLSCRYREIYVYDGANSRRDQLWLRDVAELFVQRQSDELRHYREFEISPNGNWLDLDINAGQKSDLMCDLKSRATCTAEHWTAELAIPMDSLTAEFSPHEIWRLNLFRIEGQEPNRYYSAWRPTGTPKPNFHVPERFGELIFASS
jgi:hypothetical protein